MKHVLAIVAALGLGLSAGGLGAAPAAAANDPCDDPESVQCPTSPNYDPWWYENNGHGGPTDGADPTRGPTCQNQVTDETLPPEQQADGCVLPGGPNSPRV